MKTHVLAGGSALAIGLIFAMFAHAQGSLQVAPSGPSLSESSLELKAEELPYAVSLRASMWVTGAVTPRGSEEEVCILSYNVEFRNAQDQPVFQGSGPLFLSPESMKAATTMPFTVPVENADGNEKMVLFEILFQPKGGSSWGAVEGYDSVDILLKTHDGK